MQLSKLQRHCKCRSSNILTCRVYSFVLARIGVRVIFWKTKKNFAVIIRKAVLEEFALLSGWQSQLDREHEKYIPSFLRHPVPEKYCLDFFFTEGKVCYVICDELLAIGFMLISIKAKIGVIESLFLESKYRGRGLGRNFISQIESELELSGIEHIILNVWESNNEAIKFYEHMNFIRAKSLYIKKLSNSK